MTSGLMPPRETQHFERLPVIRLRAHPPIEPRHGFHVVIEHMRAGVEHARDGVHVAFEIRRQHFHARAGSAPLDLAHRLGEMRRAAIGKIVAIHAGDHHIAQLHLRRHARDVRRFRRDRAAYRECADSPSAPSKIRSRAYKDCPES